MPTHPTTMSEPAPPAPSVSADLVGVVAILSAAAFFYALAVGM
jgi:hypothetical protein